MMHVFLADPCCGIALSKASLAGELDGAESWTHEKCGMEWKPRKVGEVWFWEAHPYIEVIRRK
jgi:hypothetical protein